MQKPSLQFTDGHKNDKNHNSQPKTLEETVGTKKSHPKDDQDEIKRAKEDLTDSDSHSDSSSDNELHKNNPQNGANQSNGPQQRASSLNFQPLHRNSIFIKSLAQESMTKTGSKVTFLQDENQRQRSISAPKKLINSERLAKMQKKKKALAVSKVEEAAICWDPTLKVEKALQGAAARKFMEYGTLPANELYQIKYFNETMRRVSQAETLKNIALKAQQKYLQLQKSASNQEENGN